jgi:hypothetical protein
METITLMTLLTAACALLFLGFVASGLIKIVGLLDSIGGSSTSYLAKLRLGLRAIERETSHLPAAAPGINTGLAEVASDLAGIDTTLGRLHEALMGQETRA